MLIFSLVRSGNGFAYGRLSYGQASMYRACPTYYVLHYCFGICVSVRMYDIIRDKTDMRYSAETHTYCSEQPSVFSHIVLNVDILFFVF